LLAKQSENYILPVHWGL